MKSNKYLNIAQHYENCLNKFGDNNNGVDWPNIEDVDKRHKIMYDVINFAPSFLEKPTLLDFGCGAGHFLKYLNEFKLINNLSYSGIDISEKFIELCKKKFPNSNFLKVDILQEEFNYEFDFIVLNGVFTEKRDLSFDEMFEFFSNILSIVFKKANVGVAFNVMSKAVDWEREDLFHLPADTLINFMTKELSRNFIIRNDYGLYEYTTYIYK